ncbi:hypothetical protein Q9K02_01730 [Qipengyuania sp. G39]|uniref:Uncharacterized protein n=1 Tax=Qipengyuania profundimaris TaxID=3067652 RepID=A0ABT9HLW1_9SPHN|nr:hypothetical protein [Qipengyuania sp. G39]MDP4573857.1 hypothetical protein [Qipengyuania sp. G39]
MSGEENNEPIHALAEHWAKKGPGELEKVQATLNLARQLLAGGKARPYAEGDNPFELAPYPWETSKPLADAPRRIFLGTVSDLATGQGHTVWFAAGLARDEDEFRRQLTARIGHTLANGAEVNKGLGEFPFSQTFISQPVRETLQRFDGGEDAPAGFLYLARWHENRS